MIKNTSCIRLATYAALFTGMAVLAGCGSAPTSRTTSSERTTITIPSPVTTTTTNTSEHTTQQR